jgi:excinuclease ABC subunit C
MFLTCLEYHIDNCLGPCEGHQDEASYNVDLQQVRNILKGKISIVQNHLKNELEKKIEELKFEEAQKIKLKVEKLKDFQSKSIIVSPTFSDLDVYSIYDTNDVVFINFFKIENGAIIQSRNLEFKKKLEETKEDILTSAITEYSVNVDSKPKEIIIPFDIDFEIPSISITVPKIGDKKKLLSLSTKNVLASYNQHLTKKSAIADKQIPFGVKALKEDLRLKNIPKRIECFDNSNIQGSNPVASMVVFKNGKPLKSDYRKFKIKTVKGPNDFASMKEVVGRRYRHLKEEQLPLPDLIVIDGGKGQLSSAVEALQELHLNDKIPIIGIAKKLEEIYVPGDSLPLYIDKRSESLKLIQRIRDEAHRFAISYHRNKRSKSFLESSLTGVPGTGKKTATHLLKKYSSTKRLKQVPKAELASEIGLVKAEAIIRFLR